MAPFVKWANAAHVRSGSGTEISEDFIQRDCTVLVVPKYGTEKEAKAYINANWEAIFENELQAWFKFDTYWPKNRTQKKFWQWFRVEFYSEVASLTPRKKG